MTPYAWIGPIRRSAPTAARRSGRNGATAARTEEAAPSRVGGGFLADLLGEAVQGPARPRPGDEPMTPETGLEALRAYHERMGAGLYYEDWPRAAAAYADRDRPAESWR